MEVSVIEVVKVKSKKHPQGWILMNAADFVPGIHEVWTENAPHVEPEPEPKPRRK